LGFTFAAPAAAGALLGTFASRAVGASALVLAFVPVMLIAAVATSLVIITLTGLAALASHLVTGAQPDVETTALLAVSTALGAFLGSLVGERLPQLMLRRGFALIVSAVAVALLVDVLALGGPPGG
jgi:uncharacterized membrane protein YfcA